MIGRTPRGCRWKTQQPSRADPHCQGYSCCRQRRRCAEVGSPTGSLAAYRPTRLSALL